MEIYRKFQKGSRITYALRLDPERTEKVREMRRMEIDISKHVNQSLLSAIDSLWEVVSKEKLNNDH